MAPGPAGSFTPAFRTAWWGLQMEAVFSWVLDLGGLPEPPPCLRDHRASQL